MLGAAVTGSNLAYCNFILMPLAGAMGVFRYAHKMSLPIVSLLVGYWVAYVMQTSDGPFFYAVLYFLFTLLGALLGVIIQRSFFGQKSTRAKKILAIVSTAIVGVALIVGTVQYVGNPIVMFISLYRSNQYVDQNYPDKDYDVNYTYYDMNTGSYICSVTDEGELVLELYYKGGDITAAAPPGL